MMLSEHSSHDHHVNVHDHVNLHDHNNHNNNEHDGSSLVEVEALEKMTK
jgi:hypothetical protein